jgi:glycosidase
MQLMLDFIPNHTARDHPWLTLHPDYYIPGNEDQLFSQPFNYDRALHGEKIFAFGRDPYFHGWSDTFQLNYGNPKLQTAMQEELIKVAELCDGVRCDMAMLILPEVFESTWGIEMQPFWPATISRLHETFTDLSS